MQQSKCCALPLGDSPINLFSVLSCKILDFLSRLARIFQMKPDFDQLTFIGKICTI